MKVLLAGGAGYIGSEICRQISEHENIHTTVIDLCWFGKDQIPADIPVIQKDIMSLTVADVAEYDTVAFLGGISNDAMAGYNPSVNFIYNASLPAYLAYICKQGGVKNFIYASSCSIYGKTDGLVTEETPSSSMFPYGLSKDMGEYACLKLQSDDFNVCCLRQATVCGHSPRMRFDLVVNTMTKDAIENQRVIVNDPEVKRPIISVDTLAEIWINLMLKPQSGVYNVVGGNYSIIEIAQAVRLAASETLEYTPDLIVRNIKEPRSYTVDDRKLEALLQCSLNLNLKWTRSQPHYIARDIISRYQNDEYKMLTAPRYYNIKIFEDVFPSATEFSFKKRRES